MAAVAVVAEVASMAAVVVVAEAAARMADVDGGGGNMAGSRRSSLVTALDV